MQRLHEWDDKSKRSCSRDLSRTLQKYESNEAGKALSCSRSAAVRVSGMTGISSESNRKILDAVEDEW